MAIRQFLGFGSRLSNRSDNNLGVKQDKKALSKLYRNPDLDLYDAYYEGRQYNHLEDWDVNEGADGTYIPIRKRKPRLQFNFARILSDRLAAKLVGKRNFPRLKVEEDPDTEMYFNLIKDKAGLTHKMIEPIRRAINTGSCFVRFSIVRGHFKVEHYLSKWCYPKFDSKDELESIEIKYVYTDHEDMGESGEPKKKWYRLILGPEKDTLFDNPDYNKDKEPEFKIVGVAEHNLGFVQGEWLVFNKQDKSFDGMPILKDLKGFIDELNYSLSQTSSAVQYNQDPQLIFKNMDPDQMDDVVRSSLKSWSLGREGEASFLEAGMTGVETAMSFREKVRLNVGDLSRIIMMDPEKMASHAQSGRSLEILHGPMVELVEELQPQLEKVLKRLIYKMAATNAIMNDLGAQVPVPIPSDYRPISLNLTFSFPPVFPQTVEELQKKVSLAVQLTSSNIVSRETMLGWLAKDFDIENVEEEAFKVDNQKVINPFGAF